MSNFQEQQHAVSGELSAVHQRMQVLEGEQQKLDAELAEIRESGTRYQLLEEISERLGRLEEMGAGRLFWADDYRADASEAVIQRARETAGGYRHKLDELQQQRADISAELQLCQEEVLDLDDRADRLRLEEEAARFEFEITREYETPEFRPMAMPWYTQGEDERRFRRCLFASLLAALMLGYLVPLWTLPEPEEDAVVEIPERLAKLVLEQRTKPKPPPEPEKPQKKDEKKPEPKEKVASEKPKPAKAEQKESRRKAERAGVLAFKDNFQDLMQDDLDNRLGDRTQLSTANKKDNFSQRSLITAKAAAGSGGINTAELSRNVGGAGDSLEGVGFSRVESSIGTEGDFAGEERPLSDGVGPSRTDEEIQIVFDRYKASLYRIYNRELRKNPALQGTMVLKITIEPDGSVSMAAVESSDMNSPSLNTKIIARVKRFNFGPKAGVPTITILFPVDFLPAA